MRTPAFSSARNATVAPDAVSRRPHKLSTKNYKICSIVCAKMHMRAETVETVETGVETVAICVETVETLRIS